MDRTKIDWATHRWNPVVGCTGSCPYCYARKMAHRFHRDFTPHWVESNFNKPMPKEPSRIFVNSMSDLADWKPEWSYKVWCRIVENPQHLFLFLTKRPSKCEWQYPENAILGISVTNQASYDDLIRYVGPSNTFLSIEPLHGPIKLWTRHKWIIVGAETGNRKGKITPKKEWLESIRTYCKVHDIPLFFKSSLVKIWGKKLPQEYPEW
jgi:protein gp37